LIFFGVWGGGGGLRLGGGGFCAGEGGGGGGTWVEDICNGGVGCPPQSVTQRYVCCLSGHCWHELSVGQRQTAVPRC